jgi:hypothetical protein
MGVREFMIFSSRLREFKIARIFVYTPKMDLSAKIFFREFKYTYSNGFATIMDPDQPGIRAV